MNVEDEIRRIIVDITKTDVRPIARETLLKSLRADSLDVIQTVLAIEEKFSIEIEDEAMQNFKTFGDIVSYVEEKLKVEA